MNNRANKTSFKIGHKHSPEVIGKISASKKGISRVSNSSFKKGMVPWNKDRSTAKPLKGVRPILGKDIECGSCGVAFYVAPFEIGVRKFCSKPCAYNGRVCTMTFQKGHEIIGGAHTGHKHSEETKKKMSENNWMKNHRGELNPVWKGGLGTERHRAMGQVEYKAWRKAVFERDQYTCVDCGESKIYLHADHIVGWAKNKDLRFEVSNGKTLCYMCHYEKTFGKVNQEKALLWGIPAKYRNGGVFQ